MAALTYALMPETFIAANGAIAALGHAGRATAAVAVLMAIWWMTEAVPIPATALVPLALFPLFGVADVAEAAAPYANPLIFLFLGGFVLALSMQRWGLERRIALIALRPVGNNPSVVIGGFMVLTAIFSMWVSNTATAAMMLPIALGVIAATVPQHTPQGTTRGTPSNFARALLLGIAVSASIGGVGTLIGTPPNLLLASFAEESLGASIGFAQWMLVGLPLVAILLPIAWVLLTRVLFPPEITSGHLDAVLGPEARDALGPMGRGEWATFVVFCVTVAAWVTRPLLEGIMIGGARPFAGLSDAGIAVVAALVLFIIPVDVGNRVFVMDWATAETLPWGVLVLFGGGLSLAHAFDQTGVAAFLGAQATHLEGIPTVAIVAAVTTAVVFLTEMTSNTATAAALIPVLAAIATGLGIDPLVLAVPVAVAASLAFMLPVATPPNAIVFGSGELALSDMVRTGVRLNLVAIAVVTAVTLLLVPAVLGS